MSASEVDVMTAAKILNITPRAVRKRFKAGKIAGRFIDGEKGGGARGKKLLIEIDMGAEQDKRPDKEQGPIGETTVCVAGADPLVSPPNIILYAGDHIGSPLQKGAEGTGGHIGSPLQNHLAVAGEGGMEEGIVERKSESLISRPNFEIISEKNLRIANLRADFLRQLELDLAENGCDRTEIVRRFLAAYNSGLLFPAIFAELGKISRSTLYEWMAAMNHGGVRALTPHYGGTGISKISEDEKNALLSLVLNQNKIKIGSAIHMAKYLLKKRDIESPSSDSTLRRWLVDFRKNHFDKWVLFREGEKAHNDKVAPYIERDRELLEVGEGLVADGHRLNFNAINPFTGKRCRPAMIVFWDWRSSYPVGWEIMLEENVQCISSALRMAIIALGKTPKWVLVDNGKAFKAKLFTSDINLEEAGLFGMYARLGIRTHFAMPYNAQSKPVERFFKTFTEWFERLLPSFVGASIEDKPAYMKRNEKLMRRIHDEWVPTIPEAMEMMAKWREFYIDQPSRGLNGQTPRQIFSCKPFGRLTVERGAKDEDAGKKPIDPADLHYLMMGMEVKTIHRNGVTFLGRHWYDDSLYGLRDRVVIRYSFADLSQIYVFTSKNEYLGAARPVAPVHPMICETGDPRDMEELKRGLARKRRLKKETLKVARMIGDKIDVALPMREIVAQIPDVVGAIEKIQAEAHRPALNPSPFLEDEKAECLSPQPAPSRGEGGKPWFFDEYEKYDWVMKQERISAPDREWIEDFRGRSLLYKHMSFDDGPVLDARVSAQA